MKKGYLLIILFSFLGFSQTDETIVNGNSKLHFKTFGKGKPLLIINGGPGMNCEGFTYIAQELAKMNYQTIIYDQRGTGQSTLEKATKETITMALMVQDMENLRIHLNLKSWAILGHSFGGIMAAYYATQHPEAIDKLIFSSSGGINLKFMGYVNQRLNANLTAIEKDSMHYYQTKMNRGDTSTATRKSRAKFMANAYVFDKSKAPIIAERLTQTNYIINGLVFDDLEKIKFDCANSFKNFKQPVLVLQGKNDIITTETAQEIATAFPNAELMLMDNCAHYGWLDAKERYFKSIQNFLNSAP
jgi:proline iminopeptidase